MGTATMTSSATAQSDYISANMTTGPVMAKESPFKQFRDEIVSLTKELIEYGRFKSWKKKVLTVLVCAVSILVFWDLIFGGHIVVWLEQFVIWMTTHEVMAVFAFITMFVVSTLIFIPPTILIFGAGYAFAQAIGVFHGILAAFFSCFLGSCFGAIIAFCRARYMMRDMIYLFARRYPLVRAADRALKRNGFRVMLLLRLCPLIPFNGLNYCCGITGVSLHDFVLSMVGVLPFQLFTVIVGATTTSLAISTNQIHENPGQELAWIILICSGIGFGIVALIYTWKLVKKELRKELEITSEQLDSYLHPHPEEQEEGVEAGIEASYSTEDGSEEWFWVWT